MARFNPSMLVPAQAAEGFARTGTPRTTKDVALANINRTKEQFAAGDGAEGRRNFKVVGDKVSFTIRVSNTALVLGQYQQDGNTADVREMVCPKSAFTEALDYFADKIKAGEFDAQLATMAEKKEGRTAKLRRTRAEKKAAQPTK